MITVKAPAKINLSLDIVGKRPDGYHEVAMVMQTVSLYDTVRVGFLDGEGDSIEISCDRAGVPCDERNIAAKAARAFYRCTGVTPRPISVAIEKQIPAEAGLAGGSADGAAVVLALNRLYDTALTTKALKEICATVGADVPFSLEGGTALATGTGTTLESLARLPKCQIVIVKPALSVSTAEAYARCDERPYKSFRYTDEVVQRLYRRDIRGVAGCLYNEFEQVLELPEINEIKRLLIRQKALGASMSGSGSAVYGIFLDKKSAEKCVNILSENYSSVFLTEPTRHGCTIE